MRYFSPMDEWTLRDATLDDEGALLSLHRALHVEHRDAIAPEAERSLHEGEAFERALSEDLHAMLREPSHHVLVGEARGDLLGYVTGQSIGTEARGAEARGVVGDWYVVPRHRSRGLGRALMEAMATRLARDGCRLLESSTLPANDRARRLHRLLGFEEAQIRYRKRL